MEKLRPTREKTSGVSGMDPRLEGQDKVVLKRTSHPGLESKNNATNQKQTGQRERTNSFCRPPKTIPIHLILEVNTSACHPENLELREVGKPPDGVISMFMASEREGIVAASGS
jgi:hypothetical protein